MLQDGSFACLLIEIQPGRSIHRFLKYRSLWTTWPRSLLSLKETREAPFTGVVLATCSHVSGRTHLDKCFSTGVLLVLRTTLQLKDRLTIFVLELMLQLIFLQEFLDSDEGGLVISKIDRTFGG